jgi:hypothetical protein
MDTIPAGFIPNEWNQTFGAFRRLVEHLDAMQFVLAECSILTSENCDVAYIREQVASVVDTLEFMANDAEKHWKALGVVVASAAGRFSLNRPLDDVAWCSSVLNAAWNLHNGLSRELSGSDSELCVQRLPLHLGRIPNDIQSWKDRITAELRAGALCREEKPKSDSTPVNAKKLADYVPCHDRVVRIALEGLKPTVCAVGRNGGHQWPYSEAVAILKRVTTGKLAGVPWPDSEVELTSKKDSSKIPAKRLRR